MSKTKKELRVSGGEEKRKQKGSSNEHWGNHGQGVNKASHVLRWENKGKQQNSGTCERGAAYERET